MMSLPYYLRHVLHGCGQKPFVYAKKILQVHFRAVLDIIDNQIAWRGEGAKLATLALRPFLKKVEDRGGV